MRKEQPAFYKKYEDAFQPLIVILYSNLAMCCLKSGEYKDCIDFATKALEINDRHEKSWYRLAMAHDKLGSYELSLEAFDSLLEINPTFPDGETMRDEVCERLKLKNSADESKGEVASEPVSAVAA